MGVFQKRGKRGRKRYIDYYVDGKRVRECLGDVPRRVAEDAQKVRLAEIAQGTYRLKAKPQIYVFAELCRDFREHLASRKAGKALQAYESRLLHLEPAFGKLKLEQISSFLVEKYVRQRRQQTSYRKKPISAATVNRELGVLKRMFNLAIQWGKAEKNPAVGVRFLKEERGPDRVLSDDEEERLLSCCSPHVKLTALFALHTGMRRGEILNLRWADLDTRQKVLTVVKSKSGKVRSIPMNARLLEAVLERRRLERQGEYLFYNDRTGKPISDTKTGFSKAVRRAGISHIRFHDLRHTFATRLVTRGVDLVTVSRLLGHASIETTMRYAHPAPDVHRRAVESLCDGHHLDTNCNFPANEESAKVLNLQNMRP